MGKSPYLSIVIPVFNEADSLADALPEIRRHVLTVDPSHEIILVDDGSTDSTWSIISDFSKTDSQTKGIKLSRNFGKESAIATGLSFVSGEAAIVMDADLQHPPELIPEMVKCWKQEKADIVEAVKMSRGREPFTVKLRARLFYWLMTRLTGLDLRDSSDFKLLDRRVIDAHNRLPETARFFRGIVSWLGFKKVQIPFTVKERAGGKSRWSFRKLFRLAIDASTAFSSLPLHLVTVLGLVMFMISILLGSLALYQKITGVAVSGFATVILLLLFIGSVLMISLGIIGVYISRIFDEVKRRPRFIVEETINFIKPSP
jgi:dolichol-phosphate mannosyltransferase